jgi:hypothetical protein
MFSFRRAGTCTKCGAPLRAAPETSAKPKTGTLGLPTRKNASLGDRWKLDEEKMRHNWGVEGTVTTYHSSDSHFEQRPLDIPFYTGLDGLAYITVLLASRSIPRPSVLAEMVQASRPFQIHAKTFLDAAYPVLRMNLWVPDNPADPFCLESPLDIRDGDAQDFLEAVERQERIRIVLAHESDLSHSWQVEVEAPGLAAVLRKEVAKAVRRLGDGGESEFRAAVNRMEQVFARATDGVDRRQALPLPVVGIVRARGPRADPAVSARQVIEIIAAYCEGAVRWPDPANEERVKEIGRKLDAGGGIEAMREVFEIVRAEGRRTRAQYGPMLERLWDGVGDWQA